MLNEYVYCPRLFHLMHVDGRWEDNRYTLEGLHAHRRVDRRDELLPRPPQSASHDEKPNGHGEDEHDVPPDIHRSITLSSERLRLTAKLDVVETVGGEAVPVDTKRGKPPDNEHRAWEPERVQLMAQGLLLREHGFRATHGVLYFAGARKRVEVAFDADLEASTLGYLDAAHAAATRPELPEPLDDSPKCNGCALSGICLPDETLALRDVPEDPAATETRRLYPVRADASPLYVQEQGASVGKRGRTLIVKKSGDVLAEVRLKDVLHLVVCGSVSVTPAAVNLLCEAAVPVVHLSRGHWFYGVTHGINMRNAFDRAAQFRAADDPSKRLEVARAFVLAKGANQRTMLRRNGGADARSDVDAIARLLKRIAEADETDVLLGLEGRIAHHYFRSFQHLLRPRDLDGEWDFNGRNRRPPKDPINALLSFGYALLAKECTVALLAEGLDPWWGLYHRPRHGRPSLALDLMEEFRPLVADSAVISAVNTGMVTDADVVKSGGACALKSNGRKAFIRALEARLDQLVTHPVFDYRCSWRQVIRLQARLLSRWLRGDLPSYTGMVTR